MTGRSRRRTIVAILRRDIAVVRGNRAVMLPLVVLPLLFVVVFPVFGGLLARVDVPAGALQELLRSVPASVFDGLPPSPGVHLAVVLLGYFVPPLTLVLPLLVALVLATDSVAGERERGTLEGLLLAPMRDRDLLTAKLAGAWLPALAVGVGASTVYAVVCDLMMWPVLGGPLFPRPTWLVLSFVLGPSLSAAALALAVLISARARTVQGAQQVAGVAVLPLVFVVVGQVSGLLFLGLWQLVLFAGVLCLVAAALVAAGARELRRDRLGPRLR